MRYILFTLLAGLMLQPAFAQKVINDPNVEVRNVGSFTGLDISSAFEVIITQGNTESVAVSSNIQGDNQNIITEVSNGKLKIGYRNQSKKWFKNQRLKAYVAVKNLNFLGGSGASKIIIEGSLSSANLKVDLSGATDMKGNLNVSGELKLDLSGASDLTLEGAAARLVIDASGASDVKAFGLTVGECNIDASGATTVRISVEKEMSADLSGASNVEYKGAAMIRNIKTSGASNISKKS